MAERLFDEADVLHERIGSAYLVNTGTLARARMHLDRGAHGDNTRAAQLLDEVLAVSASEGYGGLERQATTLRRDLSN